jgi:putative transposase
VCQVLGLARSTYYRMPQRTEDPRVCAALQALAGQWPTYGSRRLTQMLRRAPYGLRVNPKRVQRLMRELNLHARQPRRPRQTTDSQHGYRRYPNLVRDLVVTRVDQVWVGDITYIVLRDEDIYLALLLDVFTRAIRGWNLTRFLDHRLPLGALQDALLERVPSSITATRAPRTRPHPTPTP